MTEQETIAEMRKISAALMHLSNNSCGNAQAHSAIIASAIPIQDFLENKESKS